MRPRSILLLAVFAASSATSAAQRPLAPISGAGQAVIPVFEGWYKNADGTFSLSFGYFNRNGDEVIDIPVGDKNFITPGAQNQGQPTRFESRRHWGVFAVKVPANFGRKEVLWTLKFRGETYEIPGSLRADWEIDAIQGEAGSGNTPPVLRLGEGGAEAQGPGGATWGPLTANVGTPLAIELFAKDDGRSRAAATGRGAAPVTSLAWFVHQGPARATFEPATARVAAAGAMAKTNVTFTMPGEYILRVRANDASGVAGAGHAQCCWTNGFVRVRVQ